ncbi:MAG: hypothetical protein JWN34_683 [Bryobacterales bacterium]|nr:hypothetical protein [Bryobacterales bacterium]
MNKKLVPAIGAFAVLMIVAAYLLNGKVLAMVLVLLAALLAKTLIAGQQQKLRESEDQAESDSNR